MNHIRIDTEYIKLDSLLKLAGICETGGQAKEAIVDGNVVVNGAVCLTRGKKIYPGDRVTMDGCTILVEK